MSQYIKTAMSESQSQAFGLVHPEHSTPLIIDLVAGICGGSAGVLAGHPLVIFALTIGYDQS